MSKTKAVKSPCFFTIAVDFDGTVVEHAYPAIGKDVGAAPYLKQCSDAGVRLILWTMRGDGLVEYPDLLNPGKTIPSTLMQAVFWYQERGIKLFGINENTDTKSWTNSPKVLADLYIDDRGAFTPLKNGSVDWDVMGPYLLKFVGIIES